MCVVLHTGEIKCAGHNEDGQVGIGSTISYVGSMSGHVGNSLPVVNLGSSVSVSYIAGGLDHTCVVLVGRKVKCFGRNNYGQLGLGDTMKRGSSASHMGDNLPYVNLGTNVEIGSIYSSSYAEHTCVTLAAPAAHGDRIKCWGSNSSYCLGYGTIFTDNRGDAANEMGDNLPLLDLGEESRGIQIALGGSHTCVLLFNKAIKCFGNGQYGQLGSGSETNIASTGNSMPSVLIDAEMKGKLITAGALHTCIVYDDQVTMKCFGMNDFGQLGQGDSVTRGNKQYSKVPSIPAIQLGTGSLKILSIHAAMYHNCVVFIDSTIKCFGINGHGTFATGSENIIGDDINEMGSNLHFAEIFSPTRSPTPLPTNPTRNPTFSPTKKCNYFTVITCRSNPECRWDLINKVCKPRTDPTLGPSSVPTSKPTVSPTERCSYSLRTSCADDNQCLWIKDDNGGSCHVFSCSYFNELECVERNAICVWDKEGNTCRFIKDPTPSPIPDTIKTSQPTNSPINAPTSNPSSVSLTSNPIQAPSTMPIISPTTLPATALPSKSPSKSPINAPSFSPSQAPTQSPTRNPIKNPTSKPSKSPTKNPTRKPTAYGFFGAQESSLPFGVVKAFDLYLLIDTTRGYELVNNYCTQYKLMSGISPSSCFDLMMDYAIEIVKSISVATNGFYSNDLSKGLRVQASLIQCVGSTKTPSSTILFTLTGDSSIIMNGLNNARMNTKLAVAASCPIQGLHDVIQKIENEWSSVSSRPYKTIITLTDAVVNDPTNPGVRLIDVVSGIRYRCTPSIVIVPFRMTDTSTQASIQQLSLKILTGNIDSSVFEAKNAPWIVIPKIGEQISSLLSSSNTNRCTSSTSFSTADKYWCGYNTRALCSSRTSCEFNTGTGCRKIATQNGCVYGDQTSCTSNTQCQWIVSSSSNTCTRKPEEPDCNSLVLQSSCNSKSSFCSWNGSSCVVNTVG